MALSKDAVAFGRIKDALTSIELFRECYASSQPSCDNAANVVALLRAVASSHSQSDPHMAALYEHVSEGIEKYIGLKQL